MRIFIALDIDDAIRQRLARFMDGVREFASDARWVSSESLHVTLKFIGETPAGKVEEIRRTLGAVQGQEMEISFRDYGYFPTAKSARVFWIGIQAGTELAKLAATIDDAVAALGIAKDDRAFSPHLTLARSGSGVPHRRKEDGPNRTFQRLQEKLSALPAPEFGSMTAREFFLYQSQLLRGGAKYTKIARFELR